MLFTAIKRGAFLLLLTYIAVAIGSIFLLHELERIVVQAVPALNGYDRHLQAAVVDVVALLTLMVLRKAFLPSLPSFSDLIGRVTGKNRIVRISLVGLIAVGPALTNLAQYELERPQPDRLFGGGGALVRICTQVDGNLTLQSLDTPIDSTGAPCTVATPEMAAAFRAQEQKKLAQAQAQAKVQSPPPTPAASQPPAKTTPQEPAKLKRSLYETVTAWMHSSDKSESTATNHPADGNTTANTSNIAGMVNVPTLTETKASTEKKSIQGTNVSDEVVTCGCKHHSRTSYTTADDDDDTDTTTLRAPAAHVIDQTAHITFRNKTGVWVTLHIAANTYSLSPGTLQDYAVDRNTAELDYTAETMTGVVFTWKGSIELNGVSSFVTDLTQPVGYSALLIQNISSDKVSSIEVDHRSYPISVPTDARRYAMGLFPVANGRQLVVRVHNESGAVYEYTLTSYNASGYNLANMVIRN